MLKISVLKAKFFAIGNIPYI